MCSQGGHSRKIRQNYHCAKMDLKDLVREPLRHCEGDGKVTFIRPFLMLGKVTFDEQVNVMERYCKGDVSLTFTKP